MDQEAPEENRLRHRHPRPSEQVEESGRSRELAVDTRTRVADRAQAPLTEAEPWAALLHPAHPALRQGSQTFLGTAVPCFCTTAAQLCHC